MTSILSNTHHYTVIHFFRDFGTHRDKSYVDLQKIYIHTCMQTFCSFNGFSAEQHNVLSELMNWLCLFVHAYHLLNAIHRPLGYTVLYYHEVTAAWNLKALIGSSSLKSKLVPVAFFPLLFSYLTAFCFISSQSHFCKINVLESKVTYKLGKERHLFPLFVFHFPKHFRKCNVLQFL